MRNDARKARAILAIGFTIASLRNVVAETTLSRAAIQEAIDYGLKGEPEAYLLRHVRDRSGGTNDVVVGAVFTPFLRVALTAHHARERGRVITPDDISDWLVAPVIYVAVRWYVGEQCEFAMPEPIVSVVPRKTAVASPMSQAMIDGRPLEVSRGASLLRRFGVELPYDDIAVVVTFPLDVLRQDVDFVVMKYGPGEGACIERGRIPTTELSSWR